MIIKLIKLYFKAIFEAPKNIEKAIDVNRKKAELIEKDYKEKVEKESL